LGGVAGQKLNCNTTKKNLTNLYFYFYLFIYFYYIHI